MIYHVSNADNYSNWIDLPITRKIEEATIIMFSGGEDITPSYYGEEPHPTTYNSEYRDKKEYEAFKYAVDNGIFMLGTCRGFQLLTAFSGGKLVQHVNNHAIRGTHSITTNDGQEFEITSTHHQMAYPYLMDKEDYEVVAWSTETKGTFHWKNAEEKYDFTDLKEPEIVWYPKTKALGIQGHAESLKYGELHDYLNSLIKKYANTSN